MGHLVVELCLLSVRNFFRLLDIFEGGPVQIRYLETFARRTGDAKKAVREEKLPGV